MNKMDRERLEKYFSGECTPEEAEEVLAWFRSEEGMRYLEKHIDDYNELIRGAEIRDSGLGVPDDSEKMFSEIQNRIRDGAKSHRASRVQATVGTDSDKQTGTGKLSRRKIERRRHSGGIFVKVVAAALVITLTGAGYWWFEQQSPVQHSLEPTPVFYTTETEQQKLLRLVDGTVVRLNENSSLSIPENYNRDTRSVELVGEAFFDVEQNQDLPFEVTADEGLIRVLGTQFNVKIDRARHVQVAVLEGKVALSGEHDRESSSAVLTTGTFGVYNFDNRETTFEEAPVENYISWIDGTLVFEDTPLWKISRQLQWMYGSSFKYDEDEIRDLRLVASFPKDDLEEMLSIIASTLEIDYKLEGDEVIWTKRKQ